MDKITELRKEQNKDRYNLISENEKQAIEQGLEDAENGKLNPYSTARKLYEKWL